MSSYMNREATANALSGMAAKRAEVSVTSSDPEEIRGMVVKLQNQLLRNNELLATLRDRLNDVLKQAPSPAVARDAGLAMFSPLGTSLNGLLQEARFAEETTVEILDRLCL